MNEREEKKAVRDALNRSLSGLKENPFLARRIIERSQGEERIVKRRISLGFVLAMVVVLAAVAALAAGLVFSPKYSARRLADQALRERYGITDAMMTVFVCSDAGEEADGSRVFTYRAAENLYAGQIGVYTVTVKDGKTLAVWSHDGEETAGGIEAGAWGAEQLALLCSDRYGEVMVALSGETDAPAATSAAAPQGEPQTASADGAATAEAFLQAQREAWEESRAQVQAASKISLTEACGLAVSAAGSEYGLNAAQCRQLVFEDDVYGATYRFSEGQPVVDLFLRLTQKEDGTRTEKDGIYVVTVNLNDGVIEDIRYDSGLAANE